MAVAGEILLARGLEGSLRAYEKAGRGSEGWAAARSYLASQFPGSSAQSITAVLDRAREAVGIGQRYRQAGPDYSVSTAVIPSAVRLERPFVQGRMDSEGNPFQPYYRHIFEVSIRKPGENGAVIQTYQDTRNFTSPLTRENFDTLLEARAQQLSRVFLTSPRAGEDFQKVEYSVRIVGIYQGY